MSSDDTARLVPSTGTSFDENDVVAREPRVSSPVAPVTIEDEPARHIISDESVPRPFGDRSREPQVFRRVRYALSVPIEPERSHEQIRFRERFAFAAARAARNGTKFAVGSIDIGCPEAADEDPRLKTALARQCAGRLERTLRQTDVITFEPDGKVVLLVDDTDVRALDALGARLVRTLSEPVRVRRRSYAPAPALGMALWRSHDDDADRLLADADWELREVKRRTGRGWRIAGADQEPAEDQPPDRPRRRARIGPILQRTVGWVSLLTIGWVVASYSGIEQAKTLVAQFHQFVYSIPPLR